MGFTSGLMGFERVIFMRFFAAFSRDLQWDFGIVLLDSKIWVGYFRVERGLRVRETRENRVCMFRGKVVFLGPNWWVLECCGPNWYYHKPQGRFVKFTLFFKFQV